VVQLVKHPTFGFGSGHDLAAVGLSPVSGSALSAEPASDSRPLPTSHSLSIKSFKKTLGKNQCNLKNV